MSKFAVLLLLTGLGSTSYAATPLTIEQVEQLLSASRNLPDVELAEKVSELKLTERASSAHLARWQVEFPGKRTGEALLALADSSVFLDLPPSDILAIPKPDSTTRREILEQMVNYVNTTIHKLPNFYALRSTAHFDDLSKNEQLTIQRLANVRFGLPPNITSPPRSLTMRITGRTALIVTYSNGREVVNTRADSDAKTELNGVGLTTHGEFGPILAVVVGDAIKGKFFWDHWERGEAGPLAVFRYRVPLELSHYTVTVDEDHPFSPAYHGELAIDPANGAILRISVVADLNSPSESESNPTSASKSRRPGQTLEAAIEVEY